MAVIRIDSIRKENLLETAEEYFTRGVTEGGKGNIAAAKEYYYKTLNYNPAHAGAMVNLGTIKIEEGRLESARDYFRVAISVDPAYALAHFNLAVCYEELCKWDLAEAHYRTAIKLDPAYSDAHYNYGALLANSNRFMEAYRHLSLFIRHAPLADPFRKDVYKAQGRLRKILSAKHKPPVRPKSEAAAVREIRLA